MKNLDQPEYVKMFGGAGVIVGIYIGMKQNAGFWKTAIYALGLGIAGNYAANFISKKTNSI